MRSSTALRALRWSATSVLVGLAVPLGASAAIPTPVSGATTRVTVSGALDRPCVDRAVTGAGVARRGYRAPVLGFVDARLRGTRGSDFDLAVLDARSRRVLAGSANRGAREAATGFVAEGQRVVVQVCRRSGSATSARLSVRWWKRSATRQATRPAKVKLVRVELRSQFDRYRLESLGLDTTDHPSARSWDVLVHSAADERKLRQAGFTYATRIADVRGRDAANRRVEQRAAASAATRARIAQAIPSGRTTYRTLEEINAELERLEAANPGLVRRFRLPLASYEGRDIWGVEIAENVGAPADGRPAYVQVGTHHAREWPANEATLEFGLELIAGYRNGDPRLSSIVRRARTYVIPVLNVDGFDVTIKSELLSAPGDLNDPANTGLAGGSGLQGAGSGAYKRKTCRPPTPEEAAVPCLVRSTPDATADPTDGFAEDTDGDGAPDTATFPDRGVDPNRNYGAEWGGPGTSGNVNDLTYHGPSPFSESETEGFRRFLRDLQPTVLITNHTYTGLILRPPGTSEFGPVPDELGLRALGDAMARQTNYVSQFSYQLYDTTGTTDDYVYDGLNGFSFTPEIGKVEFHPAYTTGFIPEYDGQPELDANGAPTGRKLGGLREAFTLAGLTAIDPGSHSVLTGTAPAGRTLRITKDISYLTSARPNDDGQLPLGGAQTIAERRNSTLTVGADGRFEWHVNPSSQPRRGGTTPWRLTCEDAGGRVLETRDVYVSRAQTVNLALSCGVGQAPTDPLPVPETCTEPDAFRRLSVQRRGNGLRIALARRPGAGRVTVEVFQASAGRRIYRRLVRRARFTNRRGSFNWSGRGTRGRRLSNGVYIVRVRASDGAGKVDVRRITVERRNGRFRVRGTFVQRDICG